MPDEMASWLNSIPANGKLTKLCVYKMAIWKASWLNGSLDKCQID